MSSPDSALQGAVDALITKLSVQEQNVRDTKKTINTLLHHMGKPSQFPEAEEPTSARLNAGIRPDQFYGRPLATVAKEVLESSGQAMSAQDVLDALERGGYDFSTQGWRPNDRLRSFTITLSKNINAFHRLPNGFFGLPKWYPEAMKQRQAMKAERNSTPTEEAPMGEIHLEDATEN